MDIGSFPHQVTRLAFDTGQVMAGREAAPPPGPSRAEVPRSLA